VPAPPPSRLRWPAIAGCVLLLLLLQAALLYWAGRTSGGVTLHAPGELAIGLGEAREVSVTIERRGYEGPVELAAAAADGLTVGGSTIPAGAREGAVRVAAAADARPGARRVTLRATAGGQVSEAIMEVTVAPGGTVRAGPTAGAP
jgi:hypothetical protein